MKRIVLIALLAAFFAPAGAAHAAVPCRDKIYNEWYSTGKISTTYPPSCYRDALKHIPSDAQVYSNLGSDIKAALQASLTRGNGGGGSGSGSSPATTPASVGSGAGAVTGPHKVQGAQTTKLTGPLLAAPTASVDSGGGGGIALPILVLGGLAILLLAAGAIGTGVRQVRRRDARAS